MRSRFWDSGMFLVGGVLIVVLVWAVAMLGPTAIERWF